jgi:hypothetical protein
MSQSSRPSAFVRFGPFEYIFALESCEEGRRVGLQEQPSGPGAHAGTPRRDGYPRGVAEKLWPSDTFVDFDHGLNSAVARLRGGP